MPPTPPPPPGSEPEPEPEPETVPAPAPAPAPPTTTNLSSGPITLRIGERHFVTSLATLTGESHFFSSMFSGQWHNARQADGSYFVDADPDLFVHILRYLRHNVYPIFYAHGQHDLGLYAALLGEAMYFQIGSLADWLQRQRYFEAVKVQRVAEEIEGTADLRKLTRSDKEVQYFPFPAKDRVFVCPRGIFAHRGKPNACGRLCERARGNNEYEYEDEDVYKTLVIRKTVVFDHTMCLEG